MAKTDYPVTTAVRFLREHKIAFVPHLYPYAEQQGVTAHAAACLGVDEHTIVKTLVMQTDARKPLIVLMHGDCEVSTRQLARTIGARSVEPCDVKTVQKHTGFVVGGVSPFGTRTQMPIYGEATIFALERIYINGGKRGFLVEIDPGDAHRVLKIEQVHVAITQ